MLSKSCILVFLCLAATCSSLAQALQNLEFPVLQHPAPGYYLVAQNSTDSIALIDHSGKNVLRAPANFPVNLLSTDTTITYFDEAAGGFVRRNSQLTIIDTLKISGGYEVDFHEGHVLSNGNYVILGSETRIMNLSSVVPGGNTQARVIGAVFQERTFGGSTLFTWKSLDHIPVTDATESVDLTQPTIDYIHVNSVVRDTDGNFLVSCRHTDEVVKVSRTTGNLLWRMGGEKSKANQFTFIDDDNDGFTGFSHQHDVSRTASGRIVMFDNGNLKPDVPTPKSRVVEYEVNEAAKTAKRTWEFRPTPDVYSVTLGSVQELSNGNFLIGFGSGNATVIGQEVSRDGTVQAEIRSAIGMTTYRLRKALFGMAGSERVVTAAGTITFTNGVSNTYVSTVLSRVNAPTSIIVEHHSYAAHNISFVGNAPCVPLAMRWVVRASEIEDFAGSMRFNIGSLGIKVPALMSLYHRPTEGEGDFALVATTYEAAATTLVVNVFREGEFLVAYPMCYDPVPSAPANDALNVSNNVALRWTLAVQTGGYDVEIYKGLDVTGVPVRSFRTSRIDTALLLPEPSTQYTWRVRALRPAPNGIGVWSSPFTFRTRLAAPVAIAPSSLPDSIAIQQHAEFTWTRVKDAVQYRVHIVPLGTSIPALDTVVTDTTLVVVGVLPWNETMTWMVRGEIDTNAGDWSNALFVVTPPEPPRLFVPIAEAQNVDPESTSLWSTSDGATFYHIRVYKGTDGGTVWFQDSVSSPEINLVGMASNALYFWQVRSIGRYGPGPWGASQWFRTRGSSVLGKTKTLSPVNGASADTLQTALAWTSVPEATSYHVQLTSKANFSNPDVEWLSLSATTVQCAALIAGKFYRWRVMALSDVGSGPWSDTATFSTLPGPNDALEPLTPVSGAVNVPDRGNVTFITDNRFAAYKVEFSFLPTFTNVTHTTVVPAGVASYNLAPRTQYWWHVIGFRDDGVPLDTGSSATFTTDTAGPTSVSVSLVIPGSVGLVGTTLTLKGAVEGAEVQIRDIAGRQVYQRTLVTQAFFSEDLAYLPTGVYVVLFRRADAQFEVYKFLITDSR